MSAKSRPSRAQCSFRTAILWSRSAPWTKVCQMSACRATKPERLLLAAAADEDGDGAGGGRVELGPALLDDRKGLGERVETSSGSAELVAVLGVVTLEPARPDAEDEAAVADVVDGAGHVGQQLRVAIAIAGDERTELDPAGLLRPRREHGPALEVGPIGVAVERIEVVPVEEDVDAHLLRRRHGVADRAVVGLLRVKLDGDAHGSGRHTASLGGPADGRRQTRSHSRQPPLRTSQAIRP